MKHAFIAFASLSLALMVAGCGGVSERDLVGEWSGKMDMSSSATSGSSGADPGMQQMMEGMMGSFEMPLELKDDHTFKMTMVMFPAEGTWEFEDMKLTLTYTKMMGMDVSAMGAGASNKPMVLTVSKDGKTLEGVNPDDPSTIMTFTKKGDD